MAPTKRPKTRAENLTQKALKPHPSIGGGHAYGQEFRDLAQHISGMGLENYPLFHVLRQLHLYPSRRTTARWRARLQERGNYRRFVRQGNHRASVLVGIDALNLVVYRSIFPKATAAELNAFLFRAQLARGENYPRFFSPSQITRAEDRLGLSRKRGSTTAYQALLPINLIRQWNYKNQNYPHGVADIPIEDMIDLDEAAVYVETANRSDGKAYIGVRVREEGPYNHSNKFTLTAAIAGNAAGDRWFQLEKKAGTTVIDFLDFVRMIIDEIGDGTPGNRRCFTMDNLLAHKHPLVVNEILFRGHRIAFRSPYYAVDGPVEYFFNTLQNGLTIRLHDVENEADLMDMVNFIIGDIDDFQEYFRNVFGYN